MKLDLLQRGLPKWPMMATKGQDVTPDQAAEIIVRCSGLHISTNNKSWEYQVGVALGLPEPCEPSAPFEVRNQYYGKLDKRHAELRMLTLDFLTLDDRIATCYVGGPHGWCDWSGKIGESGHNIGKWPSVARVLEEWQEIAKAFPFLSLRCQLFSGEQCEDGIKPVVEYVIEAGSVALVEPSEPMPWAPAAMDFSGFGRPDRERGCTLAQLRRGVELAEARP